MVDLGSLAARRVALAVNNRGEVVGDSETAPFTGFRTPSCGRRPVE